MTSSSILGPGGFGVNTVRVTTLNGEGAYGPQYATPQTVECWVEDGQQLVRDSRGNEVVSSASVKATLDKAPLFTPGSRVEMPNRTATVITVNVLDSGGLMPDLDHIEVQLT